MTSESITPPTNRRFLMTVLRFAPGALVPALVGILTASFLTRFLSEAEFGRYSLILGVTSVVSTIAAQWIQQGVGRYLPGIADAGRGRIKQAAAIALFLMTLLLSLLLMGGLWSVQFVEAEWRAALWPAFALSLFTAAFNVFATVLQAEIRATNHTIYQSLNVLLRLALSVAAVLFWTRDWAILVWASAVATAVLLPFMWREARFPGWTELLAQWRASLQELKVLAAYGLPMIGWFLAAVLLNLGDRFVIQLFRGEAEVGIYSANYSLVARGAGLLAAPLMLAAHPFLMQAWQKGDKEEARRLLGSIVDWFIMAGVLLVGLFAVVSRDAAALLLGPGFRDGYLVMPIVLAGEVVWQLGMYTQKPLEFTKRTTNLLATALGVTLLNFALNLLLVPRFGYMAAAYNTLVCYSLYAGFTAWVGRKTVPWRLDTVRLGLLTGVTIAFVAVTWVLRGLVEGWLGYLAGLGFTLAFGAVFLGASFWHFLRPLIKQVY